MVNDIGNVAPNIFTLIAAMVTSYEQSYDDLMVPTSPLIMVIADLHVTVPTNTRYALPIPGRRKERDTKDRLEDR